MECRRPIVGLEEVDAARHLAHLGNVDAAVEVERDGLVVAVHTIGGHFDPCHVVEVEREPFGILHPHLIVFGSDEDIIAGGHFRHIGCSGNVCHGPRFGKLERSGNGRSSGPSQGDEQEKTYSRVHIKSDFEAWGRAPRDGLRAKIAFIVQAGKFF